MNGQRIGYQRVSTVDQNELRQLVGQVLDRVFADKASGRGTARQQLTELLRFVRDGDTVVVHSMDRLARNLDDLPALVRGSPGEGCGWSSSRSSSSLPARTPHGEPHAFGHGRLRRI